MTLSDWHVGWSGQARNICCALLAAFALSWGAFAASAQELRFPEFKVEDLTKAKRNFPGDLPTDPTLVLFAFTRDQQEDVEAWKTGLALEAQDQLGWLEIPVLGRGARMAKGFINGGMRKGMPDETAQARTMPYYGKTKTITEPLGLPGTDQIYMVLARPTGQVLLILGGAPTEEKQAQLEQALEAAQGPASTAP